MSSDKQTRISRYQQSSQWLQRACEHIPLGSQTFSKSHIQYPSQAAPLFLTHGKGSHVWDVDGHAYVDLVNSLLAVVLGYCDPDVDAAITQQLRSGISFSLPTTLETELARWLTEHIPCAEMCRYAKNGTDATSAAIRLARAATGRDRVALCGYHGWQDWSIGTTTRNLGIPQAVRDLSHTFPYNDLPALENLLKQHPGQFAAVILEPMNVAYPRPGYLEGVRDLAHEHGSLLIFDEIITGFRFHIGGAQTLFGVTPDLASIGKSMGNGMPISAVVGKAKYMRLMEDIFFSGTFGGEALSLAASLATVKKLERENVPARLAATGQKIADAFEAMTAKYQLQDVIKLAGHPAWKIMQFVDHPHATLWEIKSLYLQELIAGGVLSIGSHNVSFSHDESDIQKIIQAQDHALRTVRDALQADDLLSRLNGPPIQPLFRVR